MNPEIATNSYRVNFNQDFTSLSVLSATGYRLFSIASTDKVEEIFAKENEEIRIVERLFNSSLVVIVTESKPNCLKMLHFKKKQDICNCMYPSRILCVRMNRHRLVVCLAESIHIHDIRDMKILHSIDSITPNELGLCTLSLNSHLAYPISPNSGELQIFNANKLKAGITIKAHETQLSAINFSPNGVLLATASERGTVIRVFCVKNGQRVQEFRRGVKRCVRIASLVFSGNADYICASSNTETIHIFKIDPKAVEAAERKNLVQHSDNIPGASSLEDLNSAGQMQNSESWSGYLSKAVSSYFPSQVCDVLNQDRAFATALLSQPGIKHVCGLAKLQKELKLLVACEDGFLYMYDFNESKGGACKMIRLHDVRSTLDGVIELNMNDNTDKTTTTPPEVPITIPTKQVITENAQIDSKSYAGILKGDKDNKLTESGKFRTLCDAIETPTKMFDEGQFPPVAVPARE